MDTFQIHLLELYRAKKNVIACNLQEGKIYFHFSHGENECKSHDIHSPWQRNQPGQ